MDAHASSARARPYVEEGLKGGDLGVVDALFTPTSTVHDPTAPLGVLHGSEHLTHALGALRTTSADRHVTSAALLSQGGEAALAGPRRLSFPLRASDPDRVTDDKIAEAWVVVDRLALVPHGGALPGAAPASKRAHARGTASRNGPLSLETFIVLEGELAFTAVDCTSRPRSARC